MKKNKLDFFNYSINGKYIQITFLNKILEKIRSTSEKLKIKSKL